MTTNTNTKAATTATCTRCRATLTSPASIKRGKGPTCARLDRQEAAAKAAGFKATAIEKARQLIADGGIAPLRTMKSGKRVFRAASARTGEIYLTAREGCTCPAGLRARHACYHQAAVVMITAGRTAPAAPRPRRAPVVPLTRRPEATPAPLAA